MAEHIVQQLRRIDTAANWTSTDPVLLAGEIGIESDTGWHKIGDGTSLWSELKYYHGPPWVTVFDGGTPNSTYGGAPSSPFFGVMVTDP